MTPGRQRRASIPTLDRFDAFSDGVFAIAITLLVLELPVPPEDLPLVPALLEAWPDFLGYIMSFAFIGGIWLTHSGLTRLREERGDTVASGMNLLLLLLVALLPFTTSVLVTHLSTADVSVSVFLYGINVLLASLTLSCFSSATSPTSPLWWRMTSQMNRYDESQSSVGSRSV